MGDEPAPGTDSTRGRRWSRRPRHPAGGAVGRGDEPGGRFGVRARRVAVVGVGLLGVSVGLAAAHGLGPWPRSVSVDCDEVVSCRALEQSATRRLDECWLGCGRLESQRHQIREALYRAEEREAVRDHYRVRDESDRRRRELERERVDAARQRERERRERMLQREHERQMARARSREERIERERERARERRVAYYGALDASQREGRIERCHWVVGACLELTSELMDAASDDAERQRLARLNERFVDAAPGAAAAVDPPREDEGFAREGAPSPSTRVGEAAPGRASATGPASSGAEPSPAS